MCVHKVLNCCVEDNESGSETPSADLVTVSSFSQLTQTQPRMMTSDSTMSCGTAPLVLVLHPGSAQLQVRSRRSLFDPVVYMREGLTEFSVLSDCTQGPALAVNQHLRRWRCRKSVWRRLGWLQVTRRRHLLARRGFWSLRNKYRQRPWHRQAFKSE